MNAVGRRRRLLTIGHSYVVGLNRRLAHELASTGEWDVTAVAPARFRGDFAWHVAEPLRDECCTLATVPVHFSRRVHLMLYGRRLNSLLREPWDLVHCWEEPYVAAAAQIAAATSPQVPLVFATFQNIDKRYPPPFNWIERYAMARADGVIAFGQTVFDVLERRGLSPAHRRMIPPGVDAQRFQPDRTARAEIRAALGWRDDVPVVGYLGRLVPEKGLATLTEALDKVTTPWRVLLVGSGPLEPSLRAWSQKYGDRVIIAPPVGHDEVPRWLNAMDILCAPSRTTAAWREQFGRMLIEAFSCGVPVVASDSGEIPLVVADAGVIVPEGDASLWAEAIGHLLRDVPRREDLSRRGRQRVLSIYDWPVIARQHSEFFAEVIRGTSRTGLTGRTGARVA
jgi:glycosyltransferase involved in cell wall biosynthesis